MNFDLDDEQAQFRATVERFTAPVGIPARKRLRALPGGFDRAGWRELGDLGLIALALTRDAGGLGGSLVDCAVVAEALGRGLAVEPWLECGFLPARLLGDPPKEFANGEQVFAFAFAEPGQRYALGPSRVIARRTTGDLTVFGEKSFVLGGEAADVLLVTARLDNRVALLSLPAEGPGVHRRGYTVADGGRAAVVTFTDAPASLIAFDEPGLVERVAAEASLMAAAELTGLASRLFDDTLAYVKTREQFGSPIGRFQAIQHRLVECYAMLEQMRSMLWRTALALPAPAEVAGAKAFIAERALHIGHEAIQLHGGMGVTDELAIGHAHKRVVLLSKLFGDPDNGVARYAMAA